MINKKIEKYLWRKNYEDFEDVSDGCGGHNEWCHCKPSR
jgi:hypothetical protein